MPQSTHKSGERAAPLPRHLGHVDGLSERARSDALVAWRVGGGVWTACLLGRPSLTEMSQSDPDDDVRFYAVQALEVCG